MAAPRSIFETPSTTGEEAHSSPSSKVSEVEGSGGEEHGGGEGGDGDGAGSSVSNSPLRDLEMLAEMEERGGGSSSSSSGERSVSNSPLRDLEMLAELEERYAGGSWSGSGSPLSSLPARSDSDGSDAATDSPPRDAGVDDSSSNSSSSGRDAGTSDDEELYDEDEDEDEEEDEDEAPAVPSARDRLLDDLENYFIAPEDMEGVRHDLFSASDSELSSLGSTPEPKDPALQSLERWNKLRQRPICVCKGWCSCVKYKASKKSSKDVPSDNSDLRNTSIAMDSKLPSETHLSENALAAETFPESAIRSTLHREVDGNAEYSLNEPPYSHVPSWDQRPKPRRPPHGFQGVWIPEGEQAIEDILGHGESAMLEPYKQDKTADKAKTSLQQVAEDEQTNDGDSYASSEPIDAPEHDSDDSSSTAHGNDDEPYQNGGDGAHDSIELDVDYDDLLGDDAEEGVQNDDIDMDPYEADDEMMENGVENGGANGGQNVVGHGGEDMPVGHGSENVGESGDVDMDTHEAGEQAHVNGVSSSDDGFGNGSIPRGPQVTDGNSDE